MRSRPAIGARGLVLVLAMLLAGARPASAEEPPKPAGEPVVVVIPGPDDLAMPAFLFRPTGSGPHPAVVALHGCGGLVDRSGSLTARHADWGRRLAEAGFLVLMPDSFAARDLGPQCRVREREARPSRERVDDAFAAKAYLQGRPDVKVEAVSLLGWSNGGSTVLYTADRRRAERSGAPDFARAVAFYPGCRVPAQGDRWRDRVPLLILIGEADDWTPAEPCQALADAAQRRGEQVEIKTYPGAFHDFDHPDLPVRVRSDLAFSAGGSRGAAHIGTDPAARADAIARVPAFLAR